MGDLDGTERLALQKPRGVPWAAVVTHPQACEGAGSCFHLVFAMTSVACTSVPTAGSELQERAQEARCGLPFALYLHCAFFLHPFMLSRQMCIPGVTNLLELAPECT